MSTLSELYKKAKQFMQPVANEVRVRDVVREIPNTVKNSVFKGNLGRDTSNALAQTKYFAPTSNVRVRDFVRELPTGIDKTAQNVAQDVARFGISVKELPRTFKTGQATGQYYNTPFGRINSFQSEAQNRVQRGDPLWKAIGNPALETVLAGADVGALAKPVLNSAKNFNHFGSIGDEIRALAGDFTVPLGKTMKMKVPHRIEPVSPNIFDTDPSMGTFRTVNGKLTKVDGFKMARDTKPFHMPDMEVDVPFKWKSKTMKSISKPGLTVDDVSKSDDLISQARKYKTEEEFIKAQNIKESLPKEIVDISKKSKGEFEWQEAMIKRFGSGFVNPDGTLNFKALGIENKKLQEHIQGWEDLMFVGKKGSLELDTTDTYKSQLSEIYKKAQSNYKNVTGKIADALQGTSDETRIADNNAKQLVEQFSKDFDAGKISKDEFVKKAFAATDEGARRNVEAIIGGIETAPAKLLGKGKNILKLNKGTTPNSKILKPSKKVITLTEKAEDLNPEVALKKVTENLQTKFDNFEKGLYGSATRDLVGGTEGAGKFRQLTRNVRDVANSKIAEGLSSENGIIRNISRGIRSLMGGAGNTGQRINLQGQMRGGVDYSVDLANDFMKLGDEMLPSKLAKEKVWAHLDPELSGVKVGLEHLSPDELKALDALKEASDLINDTNFSMGRISHETWLKGKDGKYLSRAYTEYDVPPELSGAFGPGKGKLDVTGYMKRGDVDAWKEANAIKDPFYLASKRIQSTFSNQAITKYANWIATKADMVSDTAKNGYTKLSDSKMWGELSGKYIRHDALTDIKGFYSDSAVLQKGLDLLNSYDKWKPRQVLKKTKTVYNPATRVGNQVMNRVFAFLNGINPIAFEKNMQTFVRGELKNNGQYARYLKQQGILGTDMTKYELVKNLAKDGKEVGNLGKIDNVIASSYGAADDKAKLAAFKYWLDKGKTLDEAVAKVRSGFQDYSKVGHLYDIGAKLPGIGKPFIRFQSELARIIKNSTMENPMRAPILAGAIYMMGAMGSKLSGETAEDKKTRENRFGVPVVPFTNIPLVIMTPAGEMNIARMFGMYETVGADTENATAMQRVNKYLPIPVPTLNAPKNSTLAKENIKIFNNDVVTSPLASAITDVDFRGKSIADPKQTMYKPTTLTDSEQNINRAKYVAQGYNLPFINDVIDVNSVFKGEENRYQQVKSPKQAISKLGGIKLETFGPERAEEQRAKDAQFEQYAKDDVKKQINSIIKQQLNGEITDEQAEKRIENQTKKLTSKENNVGSLPLPGEKASASEYDSKIKPNPMTGGFSYVASNGDLKQVKTKSEAVFGMQKEDFLASDKSSMKVEGGYLRKNATGDGATFMTENKYNESISTNKLDSYKRRKDVSGWLKEAEVKFKLLNEQLEDPNTDELDRSNILEKIDVLTDQFNKYSEYGGFTKPKKGKKITPKKITIKKSSIKLPKAPTFTQPKISSLSASIPKRKVIKAKQYTPKKFKIKPRVSTIAGSKRLV